MNECPMINLPKPVLLNGPDSPALKHTNHRFPEFGSNVYFTFDPDDADVMRIINAGNLAMRAGWDAAGAGDECPVSLIQKVEDGHYIVIAAGVSASNADSDVTVKHKIDSPSDADRVDHLAKAGAQSIKSCLDHAAKVGWDARKQTP